MQAFPYLSFYHMLPYMYCRLARSMVGFRLFLGARSIPIVALPCPLIALGSSFQFVQLSPYHRAPKLIGEAGRRLGFSFDLIARSLPFCIEASNGSCPYSMSANCFHNNHPFFFIKGETKKPPKVIRAALSDSVGVYPTSAPFVQAQ